MDYDFFPASTPVLDFRPRRYHATYVKKSKEYLLWPVLGYHVLGPKTTEFNPFQRAVLGFHQLGICDHTQIAEQLALDSELIKHVQHELQDCRPPLLKKDLTLSVAAQKRLQERDDGQLIEDIVSGYVFQDPWSGKLWPRFVEKLTFAKVESSGNSSYPYLSFGSHGKASLIRPYVKFVEPQCPAHEAPTPVEILTACRQHAIVLKRKHTEGTLESDDEDTNMMLSAQDPELKGIHTISEEPELFYVLTYLYVPDPWLEWRSWFVCDPFGVGSSARLHKQIEHARNHDKHLADWLERYLGGFYQRDSDTYHLFKAIADDAGRIVAEKLPTASMSNQLLARLNTMEKAYQELVSSQTTPDRLEYIILNAAKAVERNLKELNAQSDAMHHWIALNVGDRQARQHVLEEAASMLKLSTPVPAAYARIQPNRLKLAATQERESILPLMTVALVVAAQVETHPLHTTARQMPNLLERVERLRRYRNPSAHDSELKLTREIVEELRDFVYDFIGSQYGIGGHDGSSEQ